MVNAVPDPACGTGELMLAAAVSPELEERFKQIRRTIWVGYPAGERALNHLQTLYDYPKSHRPPCCTLFGETNSGKTQIALKFARDKAPPPEEQREQDLRPVVMVTNPPFGDLRTFYTRTLSQVGVPHIASTRLDRLLEQLLSQLIQMQTRMLIIDEIQHLLAGRQDQRLMFMNSLKYLSSELQIPVVAIGTVNALRAIYTDGQLANRFESYAVPRWQPDADYAMFLTRLTAQMGLERNSDFRSRSLVTRIHTLTDGLTGETRKLIGQAAEAAVLSGKEVIDEGTLEATGWVKPGERRKA